VAIQAALNNQEPMDRHGAGAPRDDRWLIQIATALPRLAMTDAWRRIVKSLRRRAWLAVIAMPTGVAGRHCVHGRSLFSKLFL
jgi:hypothetical protein